MRVRVKTTERIVMDETGTCVVQIVRQHDHRLLQNIPGTPWESNPGNGSKNVLEPMLIIPQLPDVPLRPKEPAMSTSAKWTSKSLVTQRDAQLAKFTVECWKRFEDAMTTNAQKRVRLSDQEHLDLDWKPEGDTGMQTGGHEASVA